MLYVFDTEGNRIGANDDTDTLYAAIVRLKIPEDGPYLVFATAFDFFRAHEVDWEGGGEFDLEIR